MSLLGHFLLLDESDVKKFWESSTTVMEALKKASLSKEETVTDADSNSFLVFEHEKDSNDATANQEDVIVQYTHAQEILTEYIKLQTHKRKNEIDIERDVLCKRQKSETNSPNAENPQLRNNSEKSFSESLSSSDDNNKEPEDDEEIKFDLTHFDRIATFRQYQKDVFKKAQREGLKHGSIYELLALSSIMLPEDEFDETELQGEDDDYDVEEFEGIEIQEEDLLTMQERERAFEEGLFNEELAQNDDITKEFQIGLDMMDQLTDGNESDAEDSEESESASSEEEDEDSSFEDQEELDKIFEKYRTLMSELSELDTNLQKEAKRSRSRDK
ncbi:2695_t:CDS:2 [Acaulospora morrowiae]|uniref:2695_t:CDS:1 n=1 Tax=Acaulospora morrowiae TaxID=94023 RepID=A0A9N8ZCN1_9GLOM|nr:2695_t:CDS:2 [Acaulospora morrowiae]